MANDGASVTYSTNARNIGIHVRRALAWLSINLQTTQSMQLMAETVQNADSNGPCTALCNVLVVLEEGDYTIASIYFKLVSAEVQAWFVVAMTYRQLIVKTR